MSTNLSDKFCPRPFSVAEIAVNGSVRCCPAAWQNAVIGNIQQTSLHDAWNSPQAQAIRQSILDGKFTQCNRLGCPRLQAGGIGLVDRDDIKDTYYRRIIDQGLTKLPLGPRDILVNCGADLDATKLHGRVFTTSLADARYITMSNECEPFENDVYLRAMREFEWSKYLSLKINLVTNGERLTPKMWASVSNCHHAIASINFKLSAATAKTYRRINAKDGFHALLANLRHAARLRKDFKIEWLSFTVDVTRHNFREMPLFVELAEEHGVDVIHFNHERQAHGVVPLEVARNAMHQPTHPFHDEFLEIINHPALQHPLVRLNNLQEFVGRAAPDTASMRRGLLRHFGRRMQRAVMLSVAYFFMHS